MTVKRECDLFASFAHDYTLPKEVRAKWIEHKIKAYEREMDDVVQSLAYVRNLLKEVKEQ